MPILLLLMLATPQAGCRGDTTPAINACLAAQQTADQTQLDRYLAAARKRVAEDNPATLSAFDTAQTTWLSYRKAACDAVYSYWSSGTIRGAQAISCQRQLTQQRTHDIWQDWLTYEDSTPPILPEPTAKSTG